MVESEALADQSGGGNKRRVAYFYDTDIGSYYYGPGHPMKPQRIRMTHSLILGYDMYKKMDVYRPHEATESELASFHDSDYIRFLAEIDPDNYKQFSGRLRRFNAGDATDCPIFEGLFEFQQSCAGASIDAAMQLNHKSCDIAVNWSGGLHHAKRAEASGFCYINDIVLGILELLKYHTRVMYIDIDIHHGDGVEEAFFLTHRVMTVSFHKHGDYFPGTGDVVDVGAGSGKYYAVNVPLDDGVDDSTFVPLFKTVISKAVGVYRPECIVLQCGADSVTGDRLGLFNLSIAGHASCVQFVRSLRIPLMVLGGGGYTIRNVARTWTYETAVVLGSQDTLPDAIPTNEYYDYFAPDYRLHLTPDSSLTNKNSKEFIRHLQAKIFNNLSHLENAPGVHFAHVPPDFFTRDQTSDDLDELEQYTVEWEGGGLALGADSLLSSRLPHLLRRGDHFGGTGVHDAVSGKLEAQEEDRDQKRGTSYLRL